MRHIQLVTTTSSIEGWDIKNYLGVVSAQIVIGANIFKDVFASWRDVFGGNVKGYQKELEKMEAVALDELKRKAVEKGGNIILGLRLDYDEISGGGKSMFMLTASGTAVLASSGNIVVVENAEETVSIEQLDFEINKREIIEKLKEGDFKVESNKLIKDLTKYKIEAIEHVLHFVNASPNSYSDEKETTLIEYFSTISHKAISAYIKGDKFLALKDVTFRRLHDILDEIQWFDFAAIEYLLSLEENGAHQRAIYLLELEKTEYNINDVELLRDISVKIKSIYIPYPKIVHSKGTFGKQKEMWVCKSCKKENPIDSDTCTDTYCSANKFGFHKPYLNPLKLSEDLAWKAETLDKMLKQTSKVL